VRRCAGALWRLGGKASKLSEARFSASAATISNNRQPSVLNRDRYRCVDGEAGLFQPETFQKNEWRHAISARGSTFWDIVPVAFTDFQGTVVHGYAPVVQFLGCVSKAVGRLETATGTAPTISCKQVFYSPDLPTITSRISGTKKPQYFRGAVLPACWSFWAPAQTLPGFAMLSIWTV
jgi:hypothetical protein